jgi:hypothetical protein
MHSYGRSLLVLLCAPLAAAGSARAQSLQPASARKQAIAARVPNGSIRVDGRLDEEIWLRGSPITDFTEKEPTEGAEPTDLTEVRFAYDDSAVYVAARMSTRNAPALQAPLGRRDNSSQAEHIQIWLDTFLDRRTAVMFGVTASGVRLDRFHASDNEDNSDSGFNPVWAAETATAADGWTAELWIPFSQLRFSPQSDQVWGLNIRRFRPTLDEEDYWVLVPRTERVFISRFGELRGISGVRPTRRIEFLPYLAGASTVNGRRDPRNPFDDGRNLTNRVGGDVKMGLGPNLTLEATVNPDFGQVEADPAEVNLTVFETRFSERRPFFLEGDQLFRVNHPNYYYSRRIGARPIGPASADFVDYPTDSTILMAGKLTGRLPSKTSVAVLSAVTGAESASVFDLGTLGTSTIPVGPRAYWGVGRIQQEFGSLGSTVGVLVNSLHRDVTPGDPLADLLSENALAVAGDTQLRFKGGEYQFQWTGGPSFVSGAPQAIERLQRSSTHFAQRPDRDYARLDPTRTSLAGFSMQTRFERVSGRHWLWNVQTKLDTPFFETTDLSNFRGADGIMPTGNVTWRQTRPGRVFRSYQFGLNQSWEWNFGGTRQTAQLRPSANFTWTNYWTTSIQVSRTLQTLDSTLTRGGPLMQKARDWSTNLNVGNRNTSQTRISGSVNIGGHEDGGSTRRVSSEFSFRPGPRWQFSAGPFYERLTEPQQYVQTLSGGRLETYNNRYIFAFIDRSTISTELRMGLTVRPDMNLDIYAEPFAASGRYYDYGELLKPRVRDRITYGTTSGTTLTVADDGSRIVSEGGSIFTLRNRDFNTLSFRSNVVLRWEWRPGSTLYVVWQQDRSSSAVLGSYVGINDMFNSLRAPGSNFFVIKTSFWLPVR